MTAEKTAPKDEKLKFPRKMPTGGALRARPQAPQEFYGTIIDLKTTLDDVLAPAFFAHHAEKFKIGGEEQHGFPEITLVWADGSRYLRLIVLGKGKMTAIVKVLEDKDLRGAGADVEASDDVKAEGGEEYFVKFLPKKKHCVYRAADKVIVAEGFDTRELALEEMNKIIANLANAA